MYNLRCCIKLTNFNKYPSLLKTSCVKNLSEGTNESLS